jgi:endonuclease/exonuclease/phosphatase family metal-dependent hydrolase
MPSPAIPLLSASEIAALGGQVASRAAELACELVWLDSVDVRQPPVGSLPSQLHVVTFNAERGSRFDGICRLLTTHPALRDADVLLLNEVDWGMARSDNRHVARELADVLGLGYVFGIEFVELTKGEAAELDSPGENTWSLHGNAVLSRWPLQQPRLLRLPRRCSWAEGTQQRIGGRMAVLAELETAGGPLTLASVHLENRTTPQGRQQQMQALLDALAGNHAALIGGDLNTATLDGGDDLQILSVPEMLQRDPQRLRHPQPYEPLFDDVRAGGFVVDALNVAQVSTNVPMGILDPAYGLKLDWLFGRGLEPANHPEPPQVVRAEWQGTRVSDHDFVVAHVRLAAPS